MWYDLLQEGSHLPLASLTNEDIHHLLLLHVNDKRGITSRITGCVHNKTRLCVRWAYFMYHLLLDSHGTFIKDSVHCYWVHPQDASSVSRNIGLRFTCNWLSKVSTYHRTWTARSNDEHSHQVLHGSAPLPRP